MKYTTLTTSHTAKTTARQCLCSLVYFSSHARVLVAQQKKKQLKWPSGSYSV